MQEAKGLYLTLVFCKFKHMTIIEKKQQLRKHKMLATGLFILMAAVFIGMSWAINSAPRSWMFYVRAFSEAAMVGALADWFAVTALFHYPMGLRIPHTNLIENSKQRIGDNLGHFVVDNFLTAGNLRPYISKLDLAKYVAEWLKKEKNKQLLAREASNYLRKIILELDDVFVVGAIERKGKEFIDTLNVNELVGNGLEYVLDKGLHDQLVTFLARKLKIYISENQEFVKEKVKAESSILVPGFVDNIIARKIAGGLVNYFNEIELDPQHKIRKDVAQQLLIVAADIRTKVQWRSDLEKLKTDLLQGGQAAKMAADIWRSVKNGLLTGLESDRSALKDYLKRSVDDIADTFDNDKVFVDKVNAWVRKNAYRLVLRNKGSLGDLISQTVGNWQGRDLSEKLELEVGKDLQYIRINGTLVGGLVGLVIYTLSHLLF